MKKEDIEKVTKIYEPLVKADEEKATKGKPPLIKRQSSLSQLWHFLRHPAATVATIARRNSHTEDDQQPDESLQQPAIPETVPEQTASA